MHRRKELSVASLIWQWPPGQLHKVQGDVLKQLGYSHQFLLFNDPIPTGTDVVFVQGPYGSLLPLVRHLKDSSSSRRPILVYWFQQSLDLVPLKKVRKVLAPIFSDLHRQYHEAGLIGNSLNKVASRLLNTKGRRLGFLGDMVWLYNHGLLDVLALSSSIYSEYLEQQYGIPSMLVPRGYHSAYGSVLNCERDIAAVWMGKLRTRRRRNAVHWLQDQLEKRGQTMHIYDGVENPFIFGEKRTQILNRTWFVPNIFFSDPTNELSIRFYVAAANGAVVVTEPLLNEYSFVPDRHLVACSVEDMPDNIMYYLERKEAWRSMSEGMLDHMKNDLTLESSIAAIMAEAEAIKQK